MGSGHQDGCVSIARGSSYSWTPEPCFFDRNIGWDLVTRRGWCKVAERNAEACMLEWNDEAFDHWRRGVMA